MALMNLDNYIVIVSCYHETTLPHCPRRLNELAWFHTIPILFSFLFKLFPFCFYLFNIHLFCYSHYYWQICSVAAPVRPTRSAEVRPTHVTSVIWLVASQPASAVWQERRRVALSTRERSHRAAAAADKQQ